MNSNYGYEIIELPNAWQVRFTHNSVAEFALVYPFGERKMSKKEAFEEAVNEGQQHIIMHHRHS